MDLAKRLFDLVDAKGETLEGDLHILDNTEYDHLQEEKEYRVYHKNGYCFDIKKEIETEHEETGEPETYSYFMYAEWDGFKDLTEEKAIKLIQNE